MDALDIDELLGLGGQDRCAVCDYPHPGRRWRHYRYHRAFLRARSKGWAPLSKKGRDDLAERGSQLLDHADLVARVEGADMQIRAQWNHLQHVLFFGIPRLSLHEYFRRHIERYAKLYFGRDVARQIRERYSARLA